MNVSAAFTAFPNEAAIIGKLLGGYTDLELDLMHCVRAANGDFDTVLKAMYRTRGETQRLDIADAFGRQAYRDLGIGTQFEMALGAVRYSLKIRNQFAHCVWWDDNSGRLAFANLEEIASLNDRVQDLVGATVRHITSALLLEQFAYFEYASNLLIWVIHDGNRRAGRQFIPNLQLPPARALPAMHSP
jgi:hypothetical protein